MPEVLLIYKNLAFLIIILSLWLSFWVYFSNRKSRINQIFFLLGISVAFWITFYYLTITSTNVQSAIFWSKLAYGAVSLFYLPFYFFFIYFLNLEKRFPYLNKIIFLAAIFLFVISISTNWIVRNATIGEGRVNLVLDKGSIGFYGMAIFLSLLVMSLLFQRYFKTPSLERLKIQYFLIGVSIWVFMNFIFNMVFPLLRRDVLYAEFGNYSVIFLLGFTAYAIVKQELFGIRVILTQALVGVIALLLLVQTLLSETTFEYIWKGGLLGLFLIFGYLLINSVKLEIKRRRELEDLSLKLATTNIRLEAALKELEKLDKAKSEFISMASHQLRTPLSAIKGYISMMIEGSYGKVPGKMLKRLQNVYQSNERLIRLINDLLNISKIDLGKIELEKEPTQVEDLIQSCYEEMKIRAEEKGLRFVFKKPKMLLPKIEIDPLKIREVILNLIDNAIRYTQKGEITIKLQMVNGKLQISIKDTGEGLTKEEQKEIFTGFVRGSAGLSYFIEGAGLGLYVAKKFIELHGGKIWAESEGKDKGSTFYVELPIK